MNRHHPIDDLFRTRLEEYGQDAPMHLWDAIERSRSKKPRRRLIALWLLPVTFLSAAGLFVYFSNDDDPIVSIGSFPIPMQPEKNIASVSAPDLMQKTNEERIQPRIAEMESRQQKQVAVNQFTRYKKPDGANQLPTVVTVDEENQAALIPVVLPSETTGQALQEETQKEAALLPSLNPEFVDYEDKDFLKGLFPPDPKCARFSTGNWYHYVDLTMSSGIPFRNFEALDSEYEGYLEARERTEKTRHTFGAGVRLSAVSDFGLAARAGIHYTRITEAFDYLNENEIRITITNVYGNNGEIIRTDTTYVSGTRRIVTPNQYQMLEIPLAVGYDLRKPKFDLLLSVGVRINLLFQPKGAFLSPQDLTPVNFSYNRADAYPAFKKRLETGWFLSAGLAYKWRPDFHLLVEPHVSYYLNSFTSPEYPISQKYWLLGCSIGIRKRL
ncbi:MAG: hypothetical protein HUU01_06880 [Saprospiraceae bacterium]|nr:hypothetical protein [Saprospiraceae bacterium]